MLRITHDEPGKSLVLEPEDEGVALLLSGLACTAAVVVAVVLQRLGKGDFHLAVIAGAALGAFASLSAWRGKVLGGSAIAEFVMGGMGCGALVVFASILVPWLGILLPVLVLPAFLLTRRLALDERSGELQVETGLPGLTLRTVRYRLRAIREATFSAELPQEKERLEQEERFHRLLGKGKRPASLALALALEQGSRLTSAGAALQVRGLDLRQEILDFALRFARVARLRTYRVGRDSIGHFDVVLANGPGEGRLPVPEIGQPADYSADRIAPDVKVPEATIPRFDPARFKGPFRIETWQLGVRVELRRPLQIWPLAISVLLGGSFTLGGLSMLAGGQPLGALIAAFAIFWGVSYARQEGALPMRSAVDWSRRRIAIAGLGWSREIPFAELAELRLEGVRRRSRFSCQLLACRKGSDGGRGGEHLLLQTAGTDDPADASDAALPLVSELAKALDVAWRRGGFLESDGSDADPED